MFEENRGSANWEAAKQFVIGKLVKITRGTKKAQNTFQHAIAAAAGFEVMAGNIPDANLQMHADEKYKLNMEAYNRHTTLLFSTVLRPFIIPEWLTAKLLLHKDTQCKKPYANSHKSHQTITCQCTYWRLCYLVLPLMNLLLRGTPSEVQHAKALRTFL
jgi:hypothetical protein